MRLRSAGLIPKLTHGGSRADPWLLTRKGVLRLATITRSPRALEAVDVFIDVFDEVAEQLGRGQAVVTISEPGRVVHDTTDGGGGALRRRIRARIEDLLDTVIDRSEQTTVRDAMAEGARDTYSALTALLQKGALQNDKTAAETSEILERVRDLFERRMSDLQDAAVARERAAVQVAREKIDLIERLLDMDRKLEPSAMARITSAFRTPPLLGNDMKAD
jgi:siroheme synthase (precorrin-2 oxidase/ferrochelatase)